MTAPRAPLSDTQALISKLFACSTQHRNLINADAYAASYAAAPTHATP